MKFRLTVIGFLIAILSVNVFMAYTIIQEEKKQTNYNKVIAYATLAGMPTDIEVTDINLSPKDERYVFKASAQHAMEIADNISMQEIRKFVYNLPPKG